MKNQEKIALRDHYKKMRSNISEQRRRQASQQALIDLNAKIPTGARVLSFISTSEEIDIQEFNRLLSGQGRLYLPRVNENQELEIYPCTSLDTLILSPLHILEPNPLYYSPISLSAIDITLVPGVVFDREKRRIGYGKGFYDRLIHKAKTSGYSTFFLGIGFYEQLYPNLLPREEHDEIVDELMLF